MTTVPSTPPTRRLRAGTRVKDYELGELLASGGFGDVYEAVHPVLERRVALKISQQRFARDSGLQERFLREARILAQIRNPHLVTVHDADTFEGRAWMAMELLEGHTLREVLDQGEPVPVPDALHIAACIAAGVGALHERDVIHRDLKPENVFLTADGRIVVMDLGAAKAGGVASQTTGGGTFGTAAYMSPEQIQRGSGGLEIDARTDVYSLGVMLYEMLSGAHPFYRPDMGVQALLLQQVHAPPPPLLQRAPWVPEVVGWLVAGALAKERRSRPGSMKAFESGIRGALVALRTERVEGEAGGTRLGALTSDPVSIARLTERLPSGRGAVREARPWGMIVLGVLFGSAVGLGIASQLGAFRSPDTTTDLVESSPPATLGEAAPSPRVVPPREPPSSSPALAPSVAKPGGSAVAPRSTGVVRVLPPGTPGALPPAEAPARSGPLPPVAPSAPVPGVRPVVL